MLDDSKTVSPFPNFRNIGKKTIQTTIKCQDKEVRVKVTWDPKSSSVSTYTIEIDGVPRVCSLCVDSDIATFTCNNITQNLFFVKSQNTLEIQSQIQTLYFEMTSSSENLHHSEVISPMTGTVIKVDVAEGSELKKGDQIGIIEVIKMEA